MKTILKYFFVLELLVFTCKGTSYPFVNRSSWGAQPATDQQVLETPVPYVVIHHTYIPGACNTTEACAASMRSMQTYHNSLEWGDIGYNFCVGGDGAAYEGRGWGVVGIHAGGPVNNVSIGICIIGDWRTELPPQSSLNVTKLLIADGVTRGVVSPNFTLVGHSQVKNTECPGTALLRHISTWDHFGNYSSHL